MCAEYVRVWGYAEASMWRSEDNLIELVSLSTLCVPGTKLKLSMSETGCFTSRGVQLSCVLAGVTSPMGCYGQLQVCLVQCPVVSILHLFLVIIIFELMFCEGMVSEPQNQEGKGTQSSFCHVS